MTEFLLADGTVPRQAACGGGVLQVPWSQWNAQKKEKDDEEK